LPALKPPGSTNHSTMNNHVLLRHANANIPPNHLV